MWLNLIRLFAYLCERNNWVVNMSEWKILDLYWPWYPNKRWVIVLSYDILQLFFHERFKGIGRVDGKFWHLDLFVCYPKVFCKLKHKTTSFCWIRMTNNEINLLVALMSSVRNDENRDLNWFSCFYLMKYNKSCYVFY